MNTRGPKKPPRKPKRGSKPLLKPGPKPPRKPGAKPLRKPGAKPPWKPGPPPRNPPLRPGAPPWKPLPPKPPPPPTAPPPRADAGKGAAARATNDSAATETRNGDMLGLLSSSSRRCGEVFDSAQTAGPRRFSVTRPTRAVCLARARFHSPGARPFFYPPPRSSSELVSQLVKQPLVRDIGHRR